jgi:restriction endonuclease Mrr
MASKEKGIMIFKDTFEYLMSGEITNEQFAELVKLVYQLRWGDGVDESLIKDKEVRLIWRTLKHTVQKSKTNAKQYQKNKTDIQPNNEFENEAPNEVPNKIPSVQFEEIQKEEDFQKEFQKDVEVAVDELVQIAMDEKGKELFNEVLTTYSNNLSKQYNRLYDDVEEQLRNMSRKKFINLKDLKEVG